MKPLEPTAYHMYTGDLVGIAVDTRNNTVFLTIGDTDLMVRGRGWSLLPYSCDIPKDNEEFTVSRLTLEHYTGNHWRLTIAGKLRDLTFIFQDIGEEFREDDDDKQPWIYILNL